MPDGNRDICRRCAEWADIVDGAFTCANDVCVIEAVRDDIQPEILGVRSRSPLLVHFEFSIEPSDQRGETLNLAEGTFRQDEVDRFVDALRQRDILVVAIHNDWLFERPRLISVHWQAVSPPEEFLRATQAAVRAAGVSLRPSPVPGDEQNRDRR